MEEMNCMEKPMEALNLFTEVNGVKITMPCDKLFEALAKMQGALDNAKKESDNPYFKSKYADLATCLQTAKKPMADNGLSISQHCTFDGQFVASVLRAKFVRDEFYKIFGMQIRQLFFQKLPSDAQSRIASGGSGIVSAGRMAKRIWPSSPCW